MQAIFCMQPFSLKRDRKCKCCIEKTFSEFIRKIHVRREAFSSPFTLIRSDMLKSERKNNNFLIEF